MSIRSLPNLLIALGGVLTSAAVAATPWEMVVPATAGLLDNNGRLIDSHGVPKTDRTGAPLMPKCVVPQAGPYRFFVQAGDPDKLLVYHSGGGACWNAPTCASGLGLLEGVSPTYSPAIFETVDNLAEAGGVLSPDPAANPFAGWTKVYLPYCTGDIGWGNRDVVYSLPQPGGGAQPLPISHRGYANIRTVTEWLGRRFAAPATAPRRVVVAGSSAGGYAAIGTLFGETVGVVGRSADISVIGDSANGIVNDAFLHSARQVWGFDATLPDQVLSAVNQGADGLPVRVYANQAQWHRGARFGQYQNAYDLVQAQFLNLMKHPEQPALWSDPLAVGAALAEWTVKARSSVVATALNPAYRFYTAAGYEHVVLVEIGPEAGQGFCSDHFDTEASGRTLRGPVLFKEWAKDMVTRTGLNLLTDDWRNASCLPDCNVAPRCPPSF